MANDDGLYSYVAQEGDVGGELVFEISRTHRSPTVLDDHGTPAEHTNVGERFEERLHPLAVYLAHDRPYVWYSALIVMYSWPISAKNTSADAGPSPRSNRMSISGSFMAELICARPVSDTVQAAPS